MFHCAYVAPLLGRKNVVGVAAKTLPGGFEKNAFRRRQDPLQREASIVNSVFTANEVGSNQWAVHPRQHVIVQRVDLAERRSHLANFGHEARGQRSESYVALLEIHTLFTE